MDELVSKTFLSCSLIGQDSVVTAAYYLKKHVALRHVFYRAMLFQKITYIL